MFAELLALDVDYRRREQPTEQEYNDRFPKDSSIIRSALQAGVK